MPPEERQDGFERLGQDARRSFQMAKDGEAITPEIDAALIGELQDWRRDNTTKDGRPRPWREIAELISGDEKMPHSTLTEIVSGKYKGDRHKYLRMIDRFLAEDRERAGRFDVRQHAEIGLTRRIQPGRSGQPQATPQRARGAAGGEMGPRRPRQAG